MIFFPCVDFLPFESRAPNPESFWPSAGFASGSGIYGANLFNIMNTAEQSQAARESACDPA